MPSRGPWIDHFGDNFLWSNATLILKGMAPYGVVSLEEMDRACEKLRAREGEADRGKAWFEEWRALGDQIEKRGDEALAKGRKITAGDYYLRAGIYHYNAERFIAPSPEKKAQCAHAYKVWHQGIRLRHPNVEFVEVPYEGTTLPALFMKAQASGPRADRRRAQRHGQRQGDEHLLLRPRIRPPRLSTRSAWTAPAWARCGACATCRAASTTRCRAPRRSTIWPSGPTSTPSASPSWATASAAITPRASPPSRSATPPASRSRRCTGTSPPGSRRSRTPTRTRRESVAQSNFQWRWVAGAKDEDEGIEIAKKFSLKDVAKNITCPFLVTHAGNDRVVPVENAQKLYDAVGSTNKTIKIFTTEEGGAEHAHVDNRQVGIDFAADWLAENMK